jgi:hypothetical protein
MLGFFTVLLYRTGFWQTNLGQHLKGELVAISYKHSKSLDEKGERKAQDETVK